MKIALKTDTYGFYIEISNPLVAREIKKNLPLESSVTYLDNKICFKIGKIDLALPGSAIYPHNGDIIWSYSNKNFLCVYFSDGAASDSLNGIKVGYTLTAMDELNQLKHNEKTFISLSDERNTLDNRILSQGEIDDLVKSIISEKDNKTR